MSIVEWNNALYSVKIEEFDNDHKKLLQLINDLHLAMLKGKGKETLSQIFGELKAYTLSHFAAEEKQMTQVDFPGLESHRQHHQDLVDQLDKLISDFNSDKREVSIDTFKLLKDWLFNHIQVVDKKYTPWLKKD
jgi:hemerythrin